MSRIKSKGPSFWRGYDRLSRRPICPIESWPELLGVSSGGMVSGWVNDDKTISVEALTRLCELRGINPAWVMGLSERREL